jgi:hypothetical protein
MAQTVYTGMATARASVIPTMSGGFLLQAIASRLSIRGMTVMTAIVVMSTFLAGCNASATTGFGWTFWSSGAMKSTVVGMKTDNESRTVRVREGQTIIIDYRIIVERGALQLHVSHVNIARLDDVISYERFESDDAGQLRITVEESGTYRISAMLRRFGGQYDITWSVE